MNNCVWKVVEDVGSLDGLPFAIVGAGLAGLEVASQLWRQEVDCVLIESGPKGSLLHINHSHESDHAANIWIRPQDGFDPAFRIRWKSASPPHFMGHSGLRELVGGRSLYWHGTVLPVEDWAFDNLWPEEVRSDLSVKWNGGEPLYARVLKDLKSWAGVLDRENPVSGFLRELGYASARPVPSAVRVGSDGRWAAYSPLADLVADPGHTSSLRLLTDTRLLGIDRVGKGVSLRLFSAKSGISSLWVERLILAAGTVESARIVASHLDRDPAADLSRLPIYDHLVQGFVCSLPVSVLDLDEFPMATAVVLGGAEKRSNLFVSASRKGDRVLVDAWEMGEQVPSSASWLEVITKDPTLLPIVHAGLSTDDQVVLGRQQESLWRLFEAIRFAVDPSVGSLSFGAFGGLGNRYSDLYIDGMMESVLLNPISYYCPLGTVDHEAGSLPLGQHVDSACRLFGFPEVSIVGPAVIPRMGAANPSLTTLSIARRLSSLLQ